MPNTAQLASCANTPVPISAEGIETPLTEQPLSEEVFEIMRAAVNFARNEQIRSLRNLRARLDRAYPGKEPQINEALLFWAKQVQRTESR